jgi:hypothetical protein
MAKNVTCKYRVTATIQADTIYELEAVKARLIRAGAKILRIDPITIVTEEPSDHRNMRLDLEGRGTEAKPAEA